MDKPDRAINVHLGADLKERWTDYRVGLGITLGAVLREAIKNQLMSSDA